MEECSAELNAPVVVWGERHVLSLAGEPWKGWPRVASGSRPRAASVPR
jgi:hypothetical protein